MTVRKTISFTEQHDEWIKARVASGNYASDSEYVRDLIRKDQRENEQVTVLRAAISDGLNSGISERCVKDIMTSVEEKMRKNGTLPPDKESR